MIGVGIGFIIAKQTVSKEEILIQEPKKFDPLNTTYTIDGQQITLINGMFEKEIASSTAKMIIKKWNEPVSGDINNDGINDASFILTQENGGSGIFYYIVSAINDNIKNESIGTNGILLGDRIAPQNVSIENGVILVNYADRKKDEPMVTKPSVGVSRYFVFDGKFLKEKTASTTNTK